MEGLVLDVVLQIFALLDITSVGCAAVVCRAWREICASDILWHQIMKRLDHHNYSQIALTPVHVKKLQALIRSRQNPFKNWASQSLLSLGVAYENHLTTNDTVVVSKLWIAILLDAQKNRGDRIVGFPTYAGLTFEVLNFDSIVTSASIVICPSPWRTALSDQSQYVAWTEIVARMDMQWSKLNDYTSQSVSTVSKEDGVARRLPRDKWLWRDNLLLVCGPASDPNLQPRVVLNSDEIRNEA